MPRWSLVLALLQKELLDLFRDKGTLFVNYGIPLLLYPVAMAVFGEAIFLRVVSQKARGQHVVVMGDRLAMLDAELKKIEGLELKPVSAAQREEIRRMVSDFNQVGPFPPGEGQSHSRALRQFLRTNQLDAILSIERRDTSPANYAVSIYSDRLESASDSLLDQLEWHLDALRSDLRATRLTSRGISLDFITPLTVHPRDVSAEPGTATANFAGDGLPYLLFLFLTLATYYPCLQTLTGERERGTLASLLSTSLTAWETLLAKFLMVFFSSISSLIMHAVSLSTLYTLLPDPKPPAPHFYQLGFLIAVVASVAALLGAVCLCAATIARTRNEGEGLLSTLLLVAITPAVFVPIANIHLGWMSVLTPLMNVSVIFRETAQAPTSRAWLLAAITVNTAAAAVFLSLAVQLFSREVVLFRGEGGIAELLSLDRKSIREPSPALSGLLFFFILMPMGYLSLAASSFHPLLALPALQLTCFLALPLGVARHFRFPLREVFFWRMPRPRSLLGAAILGPSLSLLLVFFLSILPFPDDLGDQFQKSLGLGSQSILVAILAFACLPAICEEVTYRGLILSGFTRRLSPRWAIALTAVLFGLNHFSLFRFIPTAAVGAVLSYAVWRTRALPVSMLVHALYNGTLLVLSTHPTRFGWLGIAEHHVSPSVALVGLAGIVLGLTALERKQDPPRGSSGRLPGNEGTIAKEPARRSAVG